MRLIMQQSRRRILRPSTAPAKEVEGLLPVQMPAQRDVTPPNLSLGPSFLYPPPAQSADHRQKVPSRPRMTLCSRLPVLILQTLTGHPSPLPTRWADGTPTALPILLAPRTSTGDSSPSPSLPPPRPLPLKAPLIPSQISPLPPTPLPSARSR